jgi:hypothetical protein
MNDRGKWLESTDARPMVEFLRGKGSHRKGCLVGCALWRTEYGHFVHDQMRKIGEVADQVVTGIMSRKRFRKLMASFKDKSDEQQFEDWLYPFHVSKRVAEPWIAAAAIYQADWAKRFGGYSPALCGFLREIFGPVFFRHVVVEPSWLTWNDGTIVKLAQGIYDDKAFDRIQILADALEDAGCNNSDILNHCRKPDDHVLGCWVLDLLLGMK